MPADPNQDFIDAVSGSRSSASPDPNQDFIDAVSGGAPSSSGTPETDRAMTATQKLMSFAKKPSPEWLQPFEKGVQWHPPASVMPVTWYAKGVEALAPHLPQSMQGAAKGYGAYLEGLGEATAGLFSPANIAVTAASGGAGVVAEKAVAGMFLGQAILGTPTQWRALKDAPTMPEKIKIATGMAASYLPGLAFAHGFKGGEAEPVARTGGPPRTQTGDVLPPPPTGPILSDEAGIPIHSETAQLDLPPAPIGSAITLGESSVGPVIEQSREQPGVKYASPVKSTEPVPERDQGPQVGAGPSLWPLDKGAAGARSGEEPVSPGQTVAPQTPATDAVTSVEQKVQHGKFGKPGYTAVDYDRVQAAKQVMSARTVDQILTAAGYTPVEINQMPSNRAIQLSSQLQEQAAKILKDFTDPSKAGGPAQDPEQRETEIKKFQPGASLGEVMEPETYTPEDEAAALEKMRREDEQERLEDTQAHMERGGDELVDVLKEHGLPPIPETQRYTGELKNVREMFASIGSKTGRKGYGNLVTGTGEKLKYRDVFKTGGGSLESLTQTLKRKGFKNPDGSRVETDDDTLNLIQNRLLTGKKVVGDEAGAQALEEQSYGDYQEPMGLGVGRKTPGKWKPVTVDSSFDAVKGAIERAGGIKPLREAFMRWKKDNPSLTAGRLEDNAGVLQEFSRKVMEEPEDVQDYFKPEESQAPQKSFLSGIRKTAEQLHNDIGAAAKAEESLPKTKNEPGRQIVSTSQDEEQVDRLLGKDAYKNSIVNVVIKELLQNGFDAVREGGASEAKPGQISIDYDYGTRTINVTDNGVGMTPETIVNAFLRTGGTKKSGDFQNTSGGLGVAKLAFLKGSKRIRLVTVKDGLKTVMDVDQSQIKSKQIPLDSTYTDEPNGTTVEVKIPEDYIDENGEKQQVWFDTDPDFLKNPLFGPVEVTLNGEKAPMGIHTTDWQKDNTFNFKWGHADVYVDPRPLGKYSWGEEKYPKYSVMSAGLHQFDIPWSHIFDKGSDQIPHNMVIDVRPHVDTKHPQYPFNNQREGWRGTVERDAKAIYSYLKRQGLEQRLKKAQETFSKVQVIPHVDVVDLGKDLSADQVKLGDATKGAKGSVTLPKITSIDVEPDKVTTNYATGEKDVQSHERFNKTTFSAAREIDFEKTKLDTSHLNPQDPLYHNNTNVDFLKIKGAPELHAKVSNLLVQFMREFGRRFGKDPTARPEYNELTETTPGKAWFGGISYDKSYAGLNIVNPFKAIWINPAGLSEGAMLSGPKRAAYEQLHTFLHEITHVPERNEGGNFTREETDNVGRMLDFPHGKFADALEEIYTKHWDTLNEIRKKYWATDTANSSESFKAGSPLGAESRGGKGADKGLPGEHVSKDEPVQQQGSTGTGRTKEADRPTGSLGDIISGQAAQARKAAADPALLGGIRDTLGGIRKAVGERSPAEKPQPVQQPAPRTPQQPAQRPGTVTRPGRQAPSKPTIPTPVSASAIIEELKTKPRALKPEEHAQLDQHEQELKTQHDSIAADTVNANQQRDAVRVAENDLKLSETMDKIKDVQKAREAAGEEAPTTMGKYALDKMITAKRAVNRGRPLLPAEIEDVQKWNNRINDTIADVDAYKGSPESEGYWNELRKRAEAYKTGKGPKKSLLPDKKMMRLGAEVKKAEGEWQAQLENDKKANMHWWQKAPDYLLKWRRGFVISGVHSIAKLASAAIEGTIILPVREAAGGILSHLPLIDQVASRAPREGGFNIRAEAAAIGETWKNLISDAGKNIRGQKPDYESVFGKVDQLPPELQNYVGYFHGLLKSPLARNEFTRSFVKRAEFAARHGVDLTEPAVQMEIGRQAVEDSVFWRYQNRNMASRTFKQVIASLERQGIYGKTASKIGQAELPIVTVPSNVLARTFEGVFGTIPGLARLGRAYYRGIETLKPAEADLIMRNLKTGSLGLGLTLVGFFAPQVFGGFYRPGVKKQEGDVGFGKLRTPLGDVPAFLQDNPFLIMPQFGATMRQVMDSYLRKRDADTAGFWLGTWSAITSASSSQPFVRESIDIAKAMDPRTAGDVLGEHVRSYIIPQAIQQIASMTDPAEKRYPRGFQESIMAGIPGLREQIGDVLPTPQQLGPRRTGLTPRAPGLSHHRR